MMFSRWIASVLVFFLTSLATAEARQETPIYSRLVENQTLEITSKYEVIHRREIQIRVLSVEGLEHARTVLFYDKLNEILSFDLRMVDPISEKVLHKAKLRDMNDFAQYSSSTIFDDNRFKTYTVTSAIFPVDIFITTETKAKSNFFLPTWIPVHRYNQKVNSSTLTVKYPKDFGIRYLEKNLSGNRTEKTEEGFELMVWSEEDLPIQERDLKAEDDHRLLLAPDKFALASFQGQMTDWNGLAKWQYELNRGRNALPEAFKAQVLKLVADVDDPYKKVQILYDFLQTNYRYVSIQLGIGGWQTMSAEESVKYSYGDCKALTNLMQGMLEAVGIPAYYTLVYAGVGVDDIEVDLPSNQFNHVILQVPLEDQPVWLECTSNILPAGFLGDFTSNRHVLVITPEGGYLTKTPAYDTFNWNSTTSKTEIKIQANGDASLQTRQIHKGNPAEGLLMLKNYADTRQQRDHFSKNSSVSGLILSDFDLHIEEGDSILLAQASYDGMVQKFVQNTAKRIILKPFLQQLSESMLSNNALSLLEEYEIELPTTITDKSSLEDISLDEENLKVKLSHQLEGNQLKVTREISLKIDPEADKEVKKELVKRINTLSTKSYFFTKPTLSTQYE